MLKQPVSQVRLTNVVTVRLKKHGKRFEVACYRNKVLSWRDGTEKDLDEVLQVENVFSNVSKGILANKKDLMEAFQTTDVRKVCMEVLEKGELQVSDKERNTVYENLLHEIATIVSSKCVDVETNRPLTVGRVEKEMRNIHYSVVPKKSAKQQALDVIRKLEEKGSVRRASMRLKIQVPLQYAEAIKKNIQEYILTVENEETSEYFQVVILIDPGNYRKVDDLLKNGSDGSGILEIVSFAAVEEGEKRIDR
eukprot:jgi/Galph1/3726/GphlegSOOS_G2394.1